MNLAYLERVDPARNILCFYAIRIVPTLFGEWAVVRESGRIGSPGRERQSWFASAGEVVVAGLKAGERKNGGVIEELVEAGFSVEARGSGPSAMRRVSSGFEALRH